MHCIKGLTTILLVVSTSGCAFIQDYFEPQADQPLHEEIPLAARPRVEPQNRNYFILEDSEQSVIGDPQVVFSRANDTLSDLAREYGLGYDELIAANPKVDPWMPGEGTAILLPTQYILPNSARRGVVLNIAAKRLFYYPAVADGEAIAVMTYPIGIGRVGWQTPLGETSVVAKAVNPQWYVPASVRREHAAMGDPLPAVVPPGPDNPLGTRVLKLGIPGYLIHGTNQPYGVGMRVSHGCVRLYPENIELLYTLVNVGDEVAIVNQPYLAGYRYNHLYFESHAPLEDDEISAEQHLQNLVSAHDEFASVAARAELQTIAMAASGVALQVGASDTQEIFERAKIVRNTYEPDPNAPTLAEIRALLDTPDDTDPNGEVAENEMPIE